MFGRLSILLYLCSFTTSIPTRSQSTELLQSGNIPKRRQEIQGQCFYHDNCTALNFCGWAECQNEDGFWYKCGRCLPCSMCICNSDATDFECPRDRCPAQPTKGVMFWQGIFYSTTDVISEPNFQCIRRLSISGNSFSILQSVMSSTHPASSATLTTPESTTCIGRSRSGVLKSSTYVSQGQYELNMAITSEGQRRIEICGSSGMIAVHSDGHLM